MEEALECLMEIGKRGIENSTELIKKVKTMHSDEGHSVLHLAVAENNVAAVQMLLELGFEINTKSHKGVSPIDFAIQNDNAEIAEMLFKAGPESPRSGTGMSCLHLAAAIGSLKIVKFLINFSIVTSDLDAKDHLGHTPLYHALLNDRFEIAKILIQAGCDLTDTNSNGCSLLIISILKYEAESDESYEVIKLLIDSGSDVNHRSNDTRTVLHYAAIMDKDYRLIPLLLERGADINATESKGLLPIHFAIAANNYRAFEGLVGAGSRIDWRSSNNFTILHYAIRFHDPRVIRLLLEKGSSVHAVDDYDIDPFSCGIVWFRSLPNFFTGDSEIWLEGKLKGLKLLLKQGADINHVSSHLGTALNIALTQDEVESRVIPFLLNNGAYLDFNDEAVRDLIVSSKKPGVSKLLTKHLALSQMQNRDNEQLINFDLGKAPTDIQEYHQSCVEELEQMKKVQLDKNITLYDILAQKNIVYCTHSKYASGMLENIDSDAFPIYIEDTRRRFEKVAKKQRRLDEARNGLSRLIKWDVSSFAVVYNNILRFLSKNDLHTLSSI